MNESYRAVSFLLSPQHDPLGRIGFDLVRPSAVGATTKNLFSLRMNGFGGAAEYDAFGGKPDRAAGGFTHEYFLPVSSLRPGSRGQSGLARRHQLIDLGENVIGVREAVHPRPFFCAAVSDERHVGMGGEILAVRTETFEHLVDDMFPPGQEDPTRSRL
jgi:hypothetical protein